MPGEFFATEEEEIDGGVGNEGLETYNFRASLALRRVCSASRDASLAVFMQKSLHRRALQPHFMLPNPEGVGYLHQKLRGGLSAAFQSRIEGPYILAFMPPNPGGVI